MQEQWSDWQPVKGFWRLFGWKSRRSFACRNVSDLVIYYEYSKERKH
jgi:hypothetical protein